MTYNICKSYLMIREVIASQLISSVQTVKKTKTKQNQAHAPRNSAGLHIICWQWLMLSGFWQIIHFICCLEGKWSWFYGTSRKMKFHFLGMVFRKIALATIPGDGNGNIPLSHGPLAWVIYLKLWISTGYINLPKSLNVTSNKCTT